MSSFRQLDERHVAAEVNIMEWSPTMDLIALATIQGEVFLHRFLSWQKVWTLPSPAGKKNEVAVTALAWRPDGKILAVGYDSGRVVLCDIEKANILHCFESGPAITALTWDPKCNKSLGPDVTPFYEDLSGIFLPKIPSLSKTYGSAKQAEENAEDMKKLKDQNHLNLLVLGNEQGCLQLYCFGVFKAGELKVEIDGDGASDIPPKIVSIALSRDLSLLNVLIETKSDESSYKYSIVSYSLSILKDKHQEMKVVSQKYAEITSLLCYLSATIKAISEAWEDILLEIDSKLMNYAEAKYHSESGTVSDDFLELLMFGTASESLENFLLLELTEKGLKKLGHSIELSYSNIQKLVLKHLQTVSQALFYHLCDLRGMARWEERFGSICLDEKRVSDTVTCTASFLLKATEIQQVIDTSMKNFKAFFRWLYAVILRLSEEQVPQEITKVTQQDLNFVAEFLKENFATEWNKDKKSTFSLERVGQYLKMDNLAFSSDPGCQSPWLEFLNANNAVKDCPSVYPYYPEKSLVRQHAELKETLKMAFEGPSNVLSNSFTKNCEFSLLKKSIENSIPIKYSHYSGQKTEYLYSAFTLELAPCRFIYIFRQHLSNSLDYRAIQVYFDKMKLSTEDLDESKKYLVLDVRFYNEETLTILLVETAEGSEHKSTPILVQFPFQTLWTGFAYQDFSKEASKEQLFVQIDGARLIDKSNCRRLENMRAASLAVSGQRKVACVLFASCRRVRLFEMDVEDEEEDTIEDADQSSILISNRGENSFSILNESEFLNEMEESKENFFIP